MAQELNWPRDGLPRLLDTAEDFDRAAEALADGAGPIAVDTERASGYRYGDRAFLLQIRRARTGTLLIDPEGHREELTAALAPVLNGTDWVLHAAPSDLPSLALLGFFPGRVFDTELAGRLAGLPKVNLAAMLEDVLGFSLAKGHGAEDWSKRPLPETWLSYAALDVELLLELAEAMAEILDEQGKLEWAEQEFSHIRAAHSSSPTEPSSWRDTKGVGTLRQAEQLAVARQLYLTRESMAVGSDQAVSRIIPNKVLVEIARKLPDSTPELGAVQGFPRRQRSALGFWLGQIREARQDRGSWPDPESRGPHLPSRSTWERDYPDTWAAWIAARAMIDEISGELAIPPENLMRPALVRRALWEATEGEEIISENQIPDWLETRGARSWQIEIIAPVINHALFYR